ncbi:MAG TPA: peptidoglycan bridge formation glycyltransferase FemA/FemB family protein [Patescibacteria group bacterium]|jgi:lipid II:glycine glycyltransferase (peptidoglycan interpeptide bridge formation enzyme)
MPLSFSSLDNKSTLESYLATRPEANFLQSWHWGEFQTKLNKIVFRLGIFDQTSQVGALLVVKEKAKRGNYLSLAGGPLINWSSLSSQQLTEVFNFLKDLAKREKCHFVRFRPQELDSPELRNKLLQLGIKPSPMHLTADLTLQLDLTQTEEQLMAGMRKNTRYEVRRSERENITTRLSQNPQDIQEFYDYQLALARKHHFVPFSYEFLREQFAVFAADNQAALISSFLGDQLLASAFVLFYNREAVYHYGISTPANDRLPGSYAVQWAAIKEAKQRGCLTYNFWGVAPKDEVNHRFAGVSTFKRGFGGEEVAYLPAHDLPTSPLYKVTYFFETLRKKTRHL